MPRGLVYIKVNEDGSIKSSVDKFYTPEQLQAVADRLGAAKGDMMLVLCGAKRKTQTMLGVLRLEMGNRLGLRDPFNFAPLWVVDFPLFEWDDETQRFMRCIIRSRPLSLSICPFTIATRRKILRRFVRMHTICPERN